MIIKKSALFVLVLLTLIKANPKEEIVNELIIEGQKYSYNFEIDKALKVFDTLIKKYPEDARGYHYKSIVYLWYYLGNNEEKNFDNFIKYSEISLTKLEDYLEDNPNDQLALLLTGSNYGYRALAFGKANKYLNMIWASQKSNSYLERVIDLNPESYDAYLGLGLFKFALSQVPGSFKWALNMIGFDADRRKGLQYLELAAEKGTYSKVEAEFYLSQIYSDFMFDYEKASRLLQGLNNRYPNNVLFQYSTAVLFIKERNLNQSENLLKKLLKNKDNSFRQIFAFSNFLLGDINFRKNNFTEAATYYDLFLTSKTSEDYKGIAAYRQGLCYFFSGEKEKSKNSFKLTGKGNVSIDDDTYAERKGEEVLKNDLSVIRTKIIQFYNYFHANELRKSEDSLSTLLKLNLSDDEKGEICTYLAEISNAQKEFEKGFDYSMKAISLKVKDETWISPFAYYHAAFSQYSLGNMSKAKELLGKAEDHTDFDYKSKFTSLIDQLKSKIN